MVRKLNIIKASSSHWLDPAVVEASGREADRAQFLYLLRRMPQRDRRVVCALLTRLNALQSDGEEAQAVALIDDIEIIIRSAED